MRSTTPLKQTSTLKRTPMQRGTASLARPTSTLRPTGKTRRPRKRKLTDCCAGQPCYLRLPGVICTGPDTTVPCHSNEGEHGKGMGIKANDDYTVPGCFACHSELDQGRRFSREEKAGFWRSAFARWAPFRALILEGKAQ